MQRYQPYTSSVAQQNSYSSGYSNSYPKKQYGSTSATTSVVAQRKSRFPPSSNSYLKNQQPATSSTNSVGQRKNYVSSSSNNLSKYQQPSTSATTGSLRRSGNNGFVNRATTKPKSSFKASERPGHSGFVNRATTKPASSLKTPERMFESSLKAPERLGNSGYVNRATTKPTSSFNTPQRMFESQFTGKAEVKILDSYEDDKLAASIYGAARRTVTKSRKDNTVAKPSTKDGVSGYDFDALIDDESTTSVDDSFRSARCE